MRRCLMTALGITALALAIPSAALAHRHRHHHSQGHHRFHFVHVGRGAGNQAPTPPTSTTPENAGTVASYTNNVLTLSLAGGSTVSGKVTSWTRIGCVGPTSDEQQPEGSGSWDQGNGPWNHGGGPGPSGSGNWNRGEQDDQNQIANESPCDTSLLVPGAVVRAAELKIDPEGSQFTSVWIVR